MIHDLLSLIYPNVCINCGDTLLHAEKFICITCKLDLPVTNDHLNDQNELTQKFAFNSKIKTAAAFLYFFKGGMTQKLLYQLKYNGRKELGIYLGELYGDLIKEKVDVDMIVPVPIHPSKRKRRGYNQTTYFAQGLASQLVVDVREDLVNRLIRTSSQTKKSKVQRWQNLENVYTDITEDLSTYKALIVDDVITTGATVGMLCERLVEANIQEMSVASIARGK